MPIESFSKRRRQLYSKAKAGACKLLRRFALMPPSPLNEQTTRTPGQQAERAGACRPGRVHFRETAGMPTKRGTAGIFHPGTKGAVLICRCLNIVHRNGGSCRRVLPGPGGRARPGPRPHSRSFISPKHHIGIQGCHVLSYWRSCTCSLDH